MNFYSRMTDDSTTALLWNSISDPYLNVHIEFSTVLQRDKTARTVYGQISLPQVSTLDRFLPFYQGPKCS